MLSTKAGQTYVLEYKNPLSDSSWTELLTATGNGLEMRLVDPMPLPAMRFYRVRVSAPWHRQSNRL